MFRLRRPATLVGVLSGAALLCSCGGEAPRVRTYREVHIEAQSPAPAVQGNHDLPASPERAAAPSGALRWDTPDGWQETPGSGMRLATFTMGTADEAGQCTVISLSGTAGGLEANIMRWFGQLGLPDPSPEDFSAFVDAQERFELPSGMPVMLVDFTGLTEVQSDRPDSMLVGIVSDARKTIYLKLTGPLALLSREKGQLAALCRSLRYEP